MDLFDARTDGLKLSLKLYHARELQLDYQQLMTEAPLDARSDITSFSSALYEMVSGKRAF